MWETRSESAHATITTLTIPPTIPITQTDNLNENRYQEPLGYDPGVKNARLKA
jgi:hypothetical protein